MPSLRPHPFSELLQNGTLADRALTGKSHHRPRADLPCRNDSAPQVKRGLQLSNIERTVKILLQTYTYIVKDQMRERQTKKCLLEVVTPCTLPDAIRSGVAVATCYPTIAASCGICSPPAGCHLRRSCSCSLLSHIAVVCRLW
jgi:hypothetical protein